MRIIVTGVADIDRKLRRLPGVLGRKVLVRSMRNGMKIVKSEAETQVPVDSGLTKENIKLRALKRKRTRIGLEVRVGTAPGLVKTSAAGKRTFYPAVVEYGAKGRQANPFMRRSYVAAGTPARDTTIHDIKVGLDREVTRL